MADKKHHAQIAPCSLPPCARRGAEPEIKDFMNITASDIESAIRKQTGEEVETVSFVNSGANSRAAAVTTKNHKRFFVKAHVMPQGDERRRMENEFRSLEFLWSKGERRIPEPVFMDGALGISVYSFVPGEHLESEKKQAAKLGEALDFLAGLQALRSKSGADEFGPASEARFSVAGQKQLIEERFGQLGVAENDACAAWVRGPLADGWRRIEGHLAGRMNDFKYYDVELPKAERTLSPSDVGFHNLLCEAETGRLVFIDFEYFGWDDPVKTVSDFMLQPGVPLADALRPVWAKKFFKAFGFKRRDLERFVLLYPVFSFKWCLIMLNAFLPNRSRVSAGVRQALFGQQLAKAEAALEGLQKQIKTREYETWAEMS